jgi:hypothetical protein
MTTRARKSQAQVRELVGEDAAAEFDRQARLRLHMSGEEFLRKWDAGEFPDIENFDVSWVASLISLVR